MGSKFSKSFSPNKQEDCKKQSTSQTCGTVSRLDSTEHYIEEVVCHQHEIADNSMKIVNLGESEHKVLLVKQGGEFSAIGTKCSHYGAPLASGALGNGRIRCPWHGACFNVKTGDIEDFPGFDSLPCYQVTVNPQGNVKIRAKVSDLTTNKRVKLLPGPAVCETPVVVILGGGPSGATCAETLRSEGFQGRIVVVSKENCLPYDRIKCSKMGSLIEFNTIQARTEEYYNNANIEFLTGVEAVGVNTDEKLVKLSQGNKLKYNSLYIATGSKPYVPQIPGVNLRNVFTIRTYEDARNIIQALGNNKDKQMVVLGSGFIGMEIASTHIDKADTLTVVGTGSFPLQNVFGDDIGKTLKDMAQRKGVNFVFEASIKEIIGENDLVTGVTLTDGKKLPADIVVLGTGTTFYTDFLRDTEIRLTDKGAVKVNDKLETNIKNVYAGGDIAFAPVFAADNAPMCIGHIGLAQYHGKVAALNILRKNVSLKTVPYFWTALFGKSIRYTGCGKPSSFMIDGHLNDMKFVVFSFDESEKVIAVASCQHDPIVSQFAEYVYQGRKLYKKNLAAGKYHWVETINRVDD